MLCEHFRIHRLMKMINCISLSITVTCKTKYCKQLYMANYRYLKIVMHFTSGNMKRYIICRKKKYYFSSANNLERHVWLRKMDVTDIYSYRGRNDVFFFRVRARWTTRRAYARAKFDAQSLAPRSRQKWLIYDKSRRRLRWEVREMPKCSV